MSQGLFLDEPGIVNVELITEPVVDTDEPGFVNELHGACHRAGVVKNEPVITNELAVLRISRGLQTSRGLFWMSRGC